MRTLLALSILLGSAPAMALDLDLYASLLAKHTRAVSDPSDPAGTRVDYAALRRDPDWRQLMAGLEQSDLDELRDRSAELAFWINVYNVLAIDWIVREGPVESIRDLGNLLRPVWKKTAGRVGGREMSLDQVEHRILRPMGEPRIHFAIVCASTSCPSLRREPYRAELLDATLDEQTRAFLADPRKGLALDREAGVVRLSKIFEWFDGDFDGSGGVLAFVTRHAPPAERAWLGERAGAVEVRHLDYDWRLNAVESGA